MIFLLLGIGLLFVFHYYWNFRSKLYHARFMTWHERRKILSRPLLRKRFGFIGSWISRAFKISGKTYGFAFGTEQMTMEDSTTHCAIVSQTGSGKTAKFILPTLLLNPSKVSFVVIDPSSEIYLKTSGFLALQGYQIKVLDFRPGIENTHGYNPLSGDISLPFLKEKAECLYNSVHTGTIVSDNSQFWKVQAIGLLYCLMSLLISQEKKYHTLFNLRRLVQQCTTDHMSVHQMVLDTRNLELLREFETIISADKKVLQNSLSTALTVLDKLSDPHIARITSVSNFDISDLRKQPTVLYVIVPEEKTRYYSPLTGLLFQDLFAMAMQPRQENKVYLPLLFLLEEAANTAVLSGKFPEILTTIRKRNVGIGIVLQSISQLYHAVGHANADTILGNCITKLYLSGLDDPTAESLARKFGQMVASYDTLKGDLREATRPLMTIDEIQTMQMSQGLFLHKNYRPGRFTIQSAYKNRTLRSRMRIKPFTDLPALPKSLPTLPLPDSQLLAD